MVPIEHIVLAVASIFILAVVASKASLRLGVPALLLFLLIGMLAGSEGIGGIEFDNPWLAQSLGVVALAFILFAGGLDTNWERVRPQLRRGIVLSTAAVVISATLVGLFAMRVLGFSFYEGLLLGGIVSSTDAAAVFSVLRSRSVALRGRLKDVLELESGSNDPMAVFLTIGAIRMITHPEASLWELVRMFVLQMGLGALLGYALGRVMVGVVNRIRLEYEGLYPVLTIAMVLLTYSATTLAQGNGFLAVYVAGLVVGNRDLLHRRSLRLFHDGLAWLMQIAMFIALGLLLFPTRLLPVAGVGLLLALFLMFVARPLSVFAVLLFGRMRLNQKLLVSWVGLRGAVPIVLATFPMLAGLEKAELIFNLVFFIVLTSVLVQGTTIPTVARWLQLDAPYQAKLEYPLEYMSTERDRSEMAEMVVDEASEAVGKRILELRFPKGALIVLMSRRGEFLVPSGGTVLEPRDTVLVLAKKEMLPDIRTKISGPETAAESE